MVLRICILWGCFGSFVVVGGGVEAFDVGVFV